MFDTHTCRFANAMYASGETMGVAYEGFGGETQHIQDTQGLPVRHRQQI